MMLTSRACATVAPRVRNLSAYSAEIATASFYVEGGTEIRLKYPQDIAAASGDVLVSSANIFLVGSINTEYWLHRGRKNVETSITAAAGQGLLRELSSFPTVNPDSNIRAEYGRVYRTEPHDLRSCRFILHALTPKYSPGVSEEQGLTLHNQLKACYSESMRITQMELGSSSKLCIPLLGCGVNDWPAEVSAKLFMEAAQKQEVSLDVIEMSFIEKRAYIQTEKILSGALRTC